MKTAARFGVGVATVAVASLASVALWAAAAGFPQQTEQSPILTFRTNANLVLVDVVVREKGKAVQGLVQPDFEVLEDGRPQTVTVFEEHKATDVQESPSEPALPPHVYSNVPQYRIASSANVLLLDALNTPQSDQSNAREQLLKYLHTIPPGTQIAVFTLGSRLRMISGFTTDIGAIEEALNPKRTPVQKNVLNDPEADQAEKVAEAGARGNMPVTEQDMHEFDQAMQDFRDNRQGFQEAQRVTITLGAFGELARYLSTVPGRKNLIWVSGGLSKALDPNLPRMNSGQAGQFAQAAQAVNAELSRARVAVYPVDARALMNLPDASPANVVAPTELGMSADMQAAKGEAVENDITTPQEWGESQQEMKLVAAETGGEAFYNTNSVGKAVTEAIGDGENYYTLGYVPPDGRNDGAWHTVTVKMAKGKYSLAYRRGYFGLDPKTTAEETAMLSPITEAMEHGVPPLAQVVFHALVLPAGDPELRGLQPTPGPAGKPPTPLRPPVTRYFVEYAIDPRLLLLTNLPGGGQQAQLEVTQAVYDANGTRLNFTDAGLDVKLTAAQMPDAKQNGIRVRQEIDVPGGPVWLRLGVRDVSSGRIGTMELALNGGK